MKNVGHSSDANDASYTIGSDSYFAPTTSMLRLNGLVSQHERRTEGSGGMSGSASLAPRSGRGINPHAHGETESQKHKTNGKPVQVTCGCLHTMVSLHEELEDRVSTTNAQTLDFSLAYQKEVLSRCSQILDCSTCIMRSGHMMLLGVVSDKLITSCEQAVTIHNQGSSDNTEYDHKAPAPSPSSSTSCSLSTSARSSPLGPRAGTEGNGRHSDTCIVSVGCYNIDGATEWSYVVRVLIILQLRQVLVLLSRMQLIAESTSRFTQVTALKRRKQRLTAVMEKVKCLTQS